jgi:hypothetical protein
MSTKCLYYGAQTLLSTVYIYYPDQDIAFLKQRVALDISEHQIQPSLLYQKWHSHDI